jgi:predicted phage terminase large subunit-like protein
MNTYILVDPANEKKEWSDYTAMTVYGLGSDRNYYIIERYRDRLNLGERAELLFRLHKKYKPRRVGYEQYGMQADIQHMQEQMKLRNYNFKITPLAGRMSKNDRIRRLVPLYEDGRIYNPPKCIKRDYQGKESDLTQDFINDEYYAFPVSGHDDMLDCDSRILDKIKVDGFDEEIDFAEFPEDEDFDTSRFMNRIDSL